jgi:PKHD-type hydroxylase
MTKTKKPLICYDWWMETGTYEMWAYLDNVFTDDEIDAINESSKTDSILGKIHNGEEVTDLSYRNSTISNFESSDENNNWIFERIIDSVLLVNKQFWNFDLTRIETLQYSVYDEGQFYKPHIDSMFHNASKGTRKLSFSLLLSDSDEYEGGDLLVHTQIKPTETKRKKGTIVFFPSYTLHEVTEVTKGTRRALVGWVTGPAFK